MLKLERRPLADVLTPAQRAALDARTASAADLVATNPDSTRLVRKRWDDFRAGKTSAGVFVALWAELQAAAFRQCTYCGTPEPSTVEHRTPVARAPERVFDWHNLFAACGDCNRMRQNSGIDREPLDPTVDDPLDYFGWDEYGNMAPKPEHADAVRDLAGMYNLHRFSQQRYALLAAFRAHLFVLVRDAPELDPTTLTALRAMLKIGAGTFGPLREFLLRPPSEADALLVRGALLVFPELRTLVAPWLRPPPWALDCWHDRGESPAHG